MKRYLLVVFGVLFFSQYSHSVFNENSIPKFMKGSNSETIKLPKDTPKEKWDKAIGSFQFEIIKGRRLSEIDITIIDQIELNRHNTEIMYIQYNDQIRIKILPKSTINSAYVKLDLMKTVTSFDTNN
tara:strand:+ start:160 stop:540 length:381 start_codon:yes stop_codon:yes gene_type:complete